MTASVSARAQGDVPDEKLRKQNKAVVEREFRANQATYAGNPDMWVRPAVLANRQTKKITVLAEATGLAANSTAEFFLICEGSGHAYESIAVSFASAADIVEALDFFKIPRGRPVDYSKLQLWPKGEHVRVSVALRNKGRPSTPVPLEHLIVSARTGKPLEATGLVYVGSIELPSADGARLRIAADEQEPRAIASNYNEPTTVFDVPRRAPQGDVYESQSVNPENVFSPGALLELTLEPEYKDGQRRVVDLTVKVKPPKDAVPESIASLVFEVSSPQGAAPFPGNGNGGECGLNPFLAGLTKLVEDGHDPFVTLEFAEQLPLKPITDLCQLLSTIENENGIRVEPPPKGHLYYLAFASDERFRDRQKRITQPWELHLAKKDGRVAARLTQIEQIWKDNSVEPDLKVKNFPLMQPADLRKQLDARGPGLPVILVFSSPDVLYGTLMSYLSPVLSTHGTIHVYLE